MGAVIDTHLSSHETSTIGHKKVTILTVAAFGIKYSSPLARLSHCRGRRVCRAPCTSQKVGQRPRSGRAPRTLPLTPRARSLRRKPRTPYRRWPQQSHESEEGEAKEVEVPMETAQNMLPTSRSQLVGKAGKSSSRASSRHDGDPYEVVPRPLSAWIAPEARDRTAEAPKLLALRGRVMVPGSDHRARRSRRRCWSVRPCQSRPSAALGLLVGEGCAPMRAGA
jgi:hypothetical protein